MIHKCKVVLIVEDVFGTEVFGIYVDFTRGPCVFEEIKELLTGFEIGVLGLCLSVCYRLRKIHTQIVLVLITIILFSLPYVTC